ncbi:MAG: hypothetical protein EA349_15970 [Halomonadaceae bacterium]|nr:MAG: hypothetical protein EA349_15970 [Halomonadaceae bacterium]
MAQTPPCLLFIPVSGPAGAGEFYRCQNLAAAVLSTARQRGLPAPAMHLCVSREAQVTQLAPFHYHSLSASPTRCSGEIIALLETLQPQVVVFDSSARGDQIKAARRLGARLVYISSRPNRRRKGFAWHKLRHLHEHWVLTPPQAHQLTPWERFKTRITETGVRFFSALMPPPDGQRRQQFLQSSDIPGSGYTLFVSGGGGGTINGEATAAVFQQAAREFHQRSGSPTLFIAGPLASIALENGTDRLELPSVPSETLSDLISGAQLVVTGGGSIVQQCLTLGTPCVAIPAGGKDQPARLALLHRQGVIATSPPGLQALVTTVLEVSQDAARRQELVTQASEQGYRNGLEEASGVLLEQLAGRG